MELEFNPGIPPTTWQEHQQKTVLRFVRDPQEIIAQISADGMNMVHGALGLTTEVYEYLTATTPVNRVEELGDACFYLSLVYNGALWLLVSRVGVQDAIDMLDEVHTRFYEKHLLTHALTGQAASTTEPSFTGTAIMIQDCVKSLAMYCSGAPIEGKAVSTIKQLLHSCLQMRQLITIEAEVIGTSLEVVFETNHAKLSKRYKEKFTTEAALNRDLVAEEEVLAAHCGTAEGQSGG
ncbi:nucleotide pyrophosphohydrolase domain protein [Microcystis phage Mvi-JY20]|uniref:Nucleotide pyrophosphohydrolase domain protein n=1 Tax=Microcystis phage Mvi-JY20 TaxID=3128146 RepID=A0AAX4QGY2_9CAUD